jgi:hypothetical protein
MTTSGHGLRPPSLLVSILAFVLVGPFIAGCVGIAVLAMLGGPTTTESGESTSLLRALSFGYGWFRSLFTHAKGWWYFTIVPTGLAAVIFWALSKPWSHRNPTESRLRATVVGGLKGGLAALIAWVASMSILFKFDMAAAFGSLIFAGAMVIPTGVLLGVIIGFSLRRERPNSALLTDTYTSPLCAQHGAAERER